MRGLPGDSESGENPIMPNNLMKVRGNRPQQFLKKLVGPRLISVVRPKIDLTSNILRAILRIYQGGMEYGHESAKMGQQSGAPPC